MSSASPRLLKTKSCLPQTEQDIFAQTQSTILQLISLSQPFPSQINGQSFRCHLGSSNHQILPVRGMAQVIPCGHVVPLVRVRFFDPHLHVPRDTCVQLDLQEDSVCRDNEAGWPEAPSAGIPGHLTWMSFFSYPGSAGDSLPSAAAPVLKKMVEI